MTRLVILPLLLSTSCIEYNPTKSEPINPEQPQIKVEPEHVDFGYLVSGESLAETITVTNIGVADLDIDDILLQADTGFEITLPNTYAILEQNDSMDFVVTFLPKPTQSPVLYGLTAMIQRRAA